MTSRIHLIKKMGNLLLEKKIKHRNLQLLNLSKALKWSQLLLKNAKHLVNFLIGSLKKINVNCNLKDSQDSKKIKDRSGAFELEQRWIEMQR
jgi:hypothetical protein